MPTCPYCGEAWRGTHHCTGRWQSKKPDELLDAIGETGELMQEFLQHEFGPLVRLLGEHIEDEDD